jgi:hypothetical protein
MGRSSREKWERRIAAAMQKARLEVEEQTSAVRITVKEVLLTVAATGFALGAYNASDPVLFYIILVASWASFMGLCYLHKGKRWRRVVVAVGITVTLGLFSWRIARPAAAKRALAHAGYLQPERNNIASPDGKGLLLQSGLPIRQDAYYYNRGEGPVQHAFLFVKPRVVAYSPDHPNLDAEIRSNFRSFTDDKFREMKSKKGVAIGSGQPFWDTGYTEPLTSVAIQGLQGKHGTWRIYLLSRAIWRDPEGTEQDWLDCVWISNIPKEAGVAGLPMHNCD